MLILMETVSTMVQTAVCTNGEKPIPTVVQQHGMGTMIVMA
jgi:hypothetical protein